MIGDVVDFYLLRLGLRMLALVVPQLHVGSS